MNNPLDKSEPSNAKVKGTGKVTKHVGELHSRKDSLAAEKDTRKAYANGKGLPLKNRSEATVSFGYYRTKSGLPPDVEERYNKEGKNLPR